MRPCDRVWRRGRPWGAAVLAVLGSAEMLLLPFSGGPATVVVAGIVGGAGFSTSVPLLAASLMLITPPQFHTPVVLVVLVLALVALVTCNVGGLLVGSALAGVGGVWGFAWIPPTAPDPEPDLEPDLDPEPEPAPVPTFDQSLASAPLMVRARSISAISTQCVRRSDGQRPLLHCRFGGPALSEVTTTVDGFSLLGGRLRDVVQHSTGTGTGTGTSTGTGTGAGTGTGESVTAPRAPRRTVAYGR
ncbi:DUF6114 domain-containing protein [Streptomyces sp. S186]|uniref:DUF6114 domain-containing protein n=1 Tax=Streptomyces sp. S186 TaxID=3434395 RepID=UPI003F67EF2F